MPVIYVHALNPPAINLGIGTEILYTFVIILCSLMIYFGTKELYDLSSHKGLKYFRQAFLFFALAYVFRFFTEFLVMSSEPGEIFSTLLLVLEYASLFLFMYLSLISIFYLIYCVSWKKWGDNAKIIYAFHATAILIALATIFFRKEVFYIGLTFILLLFAAISVYFASRKSRFRRRQALRAKRNNFYGLYLLLIAFWLFNMFGILVPVFFSTLQLVIYIVSLGIFFAILYNVLKKSGD